MNILCYMNKLNNGGAERVMSIIANTLCCHQHNVYMINDYKTENEYELDSRITHYYIDGKISEKKGNIIKRSIRRIRYLRKMCVNNEIDVIISFIKDANYRAIIATQGIETKNVISVRINPDGAYRNSIIKIVAKTLYSLADACVFQTKDALLWYPKNIQKHSYVIVNPVSDMFFKEENRALREKRIVACGRLTRQKRFDVLIEAFSILNEYHPDYILEIYGDGELYEELNNRIHSKNLEKVVLLKGRSEQIYNEIDNATMYVLSSDFEGLPNSVMEAMVLGLPIVSTDCDGGGARVLIEEGKEGFIVPKADPEKMAEAMIRIVSDPDLALQMSINSREKGKQYSSEKIVSEWENLLLKIVSKKRVDE